MGGTSSQHQPRDVIQLLKLYNSEEFKYLRKVQQYSDSTNLEKKLFEIVKECGFARTQEEVIPEIRKRMNNKEVGHQTEESLKLMMDKVLDPEFGDDNRYYSYASHGSGASHGSDELRDDGAISSAGGALATMNRFFETCPADFIAEHKLKPLSSKSTKGTIRLTYRRLSLRFHPDHRSRRQPNIDSKVINADFNTLKDAYNALV